MKLKVITWSPSRSSKYKECPRKVLYEDLMKLCPRCFKGKISGGYDGEPVVCDTCDEAQPERPALDRGNLLDAALTAQVSGDNGQDAEAGAFSGARVEALEEATRHPYVAKLVKVFKKAKNVTTQESIVLDSKWQRVSQYTKGAWARLKLDVLQLTPKVAKIFDWKSGGVLRSGEIRAQDKYNEQMEMYQVAVLSVYPQAEATATLVFLDAGPKFDPCIVRPPLKRSDLAKKQKELEAKLAPMFNDTNLVPRPGFHCTWCSFSKAKGGPCKF